MLSHGVARDLHGDIHQDNFWQEFKQFWLLEDIISIPWRCAKNCFKNK